MKMVPVAKYIYKFYGTYSYYVLFIIDKDIIYWNTRYMDTLCSKILNKETN